jgi:hypothetical protein
MQQNEKRIRIIAQALMLYESTRYTFIETRKMKKRDC